MYGEASLGGDWFPCRFYEISKECVRATIISSIKAQHQNIIGIDVILPKERAKLLEEPDELQTLVKVTPYGNLHKNRGRGHQRHVSAIPQEETVTGMNITQLFPGITNSQTDELDLSVRKFLHRAKKVDVTWRKVAEDRKCNCATYLQDASDGTVRVMVRGLVPASFQTVKTALKEEQPCYKVGREGSTTVETLKSYGENMSIVKVTRHFTMITPRETVCYDWRFELDNTYFCLFTSLDLDDETNFGRPEPNSSFVRSIVNPGTGWAMTKQGTQTQLIICSHINPGGWLPASMITDAHRKELERSWTTFSKSAQSKHISALVESQMGKTDAQAKMSELAGSILAKYS